MIRTLSAFIVALVATAAASSAQGVAVTTLRGQVVDAATGTPLIRARISQTAADAVPMFTDDQGEFVFNALRTGPLTLRITKAGYVASHSTVDAAGTASLRVALTRSAAVNGRVVDQYGRPGAGVFIVARATSDDRAQAPAGRYFAQVDLLGDYRLGGLPAGRYELRAMREREGRTPANLSREQLLFGPPTYVDVGPETADVTLKPGDDRHDVTFKVPGPSADCGTQENQRPSPDVVRASIHGRVTGTSGEPLPCVRVMLQSPDASVLPSYTDADGRYAFDSLPADTFTVAIQASGYVSLGFGLRTDPQPPSSITLRAGEARNGVDFTLRRLGIVSGTVRDEHGEPLEGIAMTSLRVNTPRTRVLVMPEQFQPVTDDRGYYRLPDLQPGRYMISATARGTVSAAGAASTAGYAPIYYPDTPDLGSATRVTVDGGQQLDGLDFTFSPTSTYTVTGHVVGPSGPARAAITLAYSARSGVWSFNSRTVEAAADGTFTISNVAPGDYVVQARVPGQTVRADPLAPDSGPFGLAYVRVANRNPEAFEIVMAPRSTVEGRLVLESTTPLAELGLTLYVTPIDPDTQPVSSFTVRSNAAKGIDVPGRPTGIGTITTLAGERLRFTEVTGSNRFSLSAGACRSCYLKSVSVGGADATDTPFDFEVTGRPYKDLVVVVSDQAGSLDGRVVNERGEPLADSVVIVFSTARDRWYEDSPYVRSLRSSRDGTFQAQRLAPGDYYVGLLSPADAARIDGSTTDPDTLDSAVPRAERVSVGEGQRVAVTIHGR